MSEPLRRFYSHIKKIHVRYLKGALLPLVFFFAFFMHTTTSIAQTDSTYEEYFNLFNGANERASLKILTKPSEWKFAPDVNRANDLSFVFKGSFDVNPNRNSEWFWEHIKPFYPGFLNPSKRDNIFILRLCTTMNGLPDESGGQKNCIFSEVPYEFRLSGTSSLPLATTAIYKFWSPQFYNPDPITGAINITFNTDDTFFSAFNVNFRQLNFKTLGNRALGASENRTLIPGTEYIADLWYCANHDEGSNQPSVKPPSQDYVNSSTNNALRSFENLCGQAYPAYFRIAQSAPFKIPQTLADADQIDTGDSATLQNVGVNDGSAADNLPTCAWFNITGGGSVTGCFAKAVFYLIYYPIAWFASIMGSLFDFFLGYSLSDESYRAEFAVKGWRIVRDISNIFFIIILVWTGFASVFNLSNISMKKVIPTVIINAILINFSLFGTRVVIDLSNIIARVFYNTIEVCEGTCERDANGNITNPKEDGPGKFTPLSEKIVSSFNPQKLFNTNVFNGGKVVPENNGSTNSLFQQQDTNKTWGVGTDQYALIFIIVSIFSAFILFGIAVMFWKVAFMFIGRVIGLYVVMIFAPFAVLSRGGVPIVGGFNELKWKDWWGELTSYALLAPIFIFFLYVIYMFIDTDWMKFTNLGQETFFETVISVAVPMLIVYFMVKKGADIAKTYAGKFGNMVQNTVNGLVGGAGGVIGGTVGVAAGGAALIGRNVIGRGLAGLSQVKNSKGETLAARLASRADKNTFARMGTNLLKWNKTSSWDVRNASMKVGGKEFTALGTFNKGISILGEKPVDKISGTLGLGKDAGKGGIKDIDKKRDENRSKRLKDRLNFDHLSDDEAKAAWQKQKEEKIKEKSEKNWEKHIDSTEPELVVLNTQLKALKDSEEEITKDLKAAEVVGGGNPNIQLNKDKLSDNKAEQDKLTSRMTELRTTKIAEHKKNKTHTTSEAYKKAADEEKARLDSYGKIESGKSFTAAMRAEYAEQLRENSFWLKDGKVRSGVGAIKGGSVMAMVSAITAGFGIQIGAAMAMYIEETGSSMDRATNAIIKEAKKSQGKGSKLNKLTSKLDEVKEKITKAIKEHYKESIQDFKDLNDLEDSYIETGLEGYKMKLEKEIEEIKNKPGYSTNSEEQLKARMKIKEKERVDKLMEEWEKAQENLDKHNDSNKKEEDKKKDEKKDDKK